MLFDRALSSTVVFALAFMILAFFLELLAQIFIAIEQFLGKQRTVSIVPRVTIGTPYLDKLVLLVFDGLELLMATPKAGGSAVSRGVAHGRVSGELIRHGDRVVYVGGGYVRHGCERHEREREREREMEGEG